MISIRMIDLINFRNKGSNYMTLKYLLFLYLFKQYHTMKHLFLALALSIGFTSFAQKEEKKEKKEKGPKEDERYYYKEATFETDDYKVYIMDAIAMGEFSKFKMKI